MSRGELGRVEVMARVASKELQLVDAGKIVGVSYRQVKRVWRRYREEGAEGLRHRSAGRESNRAKPKRFRKKVLGLVRKKYSGEVGERFGPTLAADAMQKIALEWPSYGSRRITVELQHRGWRVNRKRVQRRMREDNLLCLRKRKFVVTTDSRHDLSIYPNLAPSLVLTGVDQLWVADITYIRLEEEFVYLAVVLDAYSRRVIGWNLDRTLEDSLTLTALRMALQQRRVRPGLVHHSDRGAQYASGDYTQLLLDHGLQISMSRKGNPYDNAQCESFMKTLKYEEVYRSEYRDLADARSRIREFLEKIYNAQRLHSALRYLSPVEFERQSPPPGTCGEVRA